MQIENRVGNWYRFTHKKTGLKVPLKGKNIMPKFTDLHIPQFENQIHTEETISFLEETFSRFIGDNDLWDEFNRDPEIVREQFMNFVIVNLPGITIE